MGRTSSRIPRAPVALVYLRPERNAINILAEIEEQTLRGRRVQVMRAGGDRFEVVLNGSKYLVRSLDGDPVGTFADLRAAVAAGDLSLDSFGPAGASGDDDPRGAA